MPLSPSLSHLAFVVLGCTVTAGAFANVEVVLTPLQSTVGRGDNVLVRVTLTNTAATATHLLRWRTLLDGVESPLFEVSRDGQPVRYLGRRIKRASPRPSDYVRLDPGASLVKTVELSSLYEMNVTGNYTIRYSSAAMPTPGAGVQPSVGELASGAVSIWIYGRLPRGTQVAQLAPEPGNAGLSYANCSNAQQEQLATAMDAGRAMTVDSHAYLSSGNPYGERYATWFGAPDAARGVKVTSNFTAIKDAFESKPVKIDCDCNEPYFAYVYPARPYTVWVCRAFWAAAVTGTDSRGGTLLHELSHFNVVAATDDHVYGQAGAAELARSAPERAINNADSHEYFGENTPAQQ